MPDAHQTPATSAKTGRSDAAISLSEFDKKITKLLKKTNVRLSSAGVKRVREHFLKTALDLITADAILPLVQEEIAKLTAGKTPAS